MHSQLPTIQAAESAMREIASVACLKTAIISSLRRSAHSARSSSFSCSAFLSWSTNWRSSYSSLSSFHFFVKSSDKPSILTLGRFFALCVCPFRWLLSSRSIVGLSISLGAWDCDVSVFKKSRSPKLVPLESNNAGSILSKPPNTESSSSNSVHDNGI